MKKILFTIQWYPSLKSANVLCDEEIIKELKKNLNYEVHLLVPRVYGQKKYECINDVHIHRFNRNLFWTWKTWALKNPTKKRGVLIFKMYRLFLRIKQILSIPIYPLHDIVFIRTFSKTAIALHKKIDFDIVVSEYHGIETLLAGYNLKKKYSDVKYLPILWDPIIGKNYPKYLPSGFAEKRAYKFQNQILKMADFLVAMRSHEKILKDFFENQDLYRKIKYFDLPRLSQPEKRSSDKSYIKPNFINMVYAGALYLPERDPYKLLQSLDKLDIPNINVIIFTSSDVEMLNNRQSFNKISVTYYNYIDRNSLLSVYEAVDFFINLGDSNYNMLPSKIFEYMSYGKPIISTYLSEVDCTISYLKRYPLCYLFDQNKLKPIDGLKQFILDFKNKRLEFNEIVRLFPENTPKKYVMLINDMLKC